MILEQQVVSLELAQKLKELGVKQKSLFYYAKVSKEEWLLGVHKIIGYTVYQQEGSVMGTDTIPAFTVAELGEMLPMEYMSIKDGGDRWFGVKQGALWEFEMIKYPDPIVSNLEADCRAKILIYLLENKLITL